MFRWMKRRKRRSVVDVWEYQDALDFLMEWHNPYLPPATPIKEVIE